MPEVFQRDRSLRLEAIQCHPVPTMHACMSVHGST